jgi:ABC-2 type transport system permease protein
MQYRLAFLLEALTTAFATALAFLTVVLVLDQFEDIGGWTLGEVAFLYGMAETAFGVMDMVFSGFDPANFGARIRLGSLDQMMLRPAGLTLQVLASDFQTRRIGRIAQGGLILAYALSRPGIDWDLPRLLYLPLVFAGLVAFFGGLFITGSTFSFWTTESIEIVNIFTYGGTEMISYPMHIYQDWMVRFFTFVVPAIFLNYLPALYFLGKPDPFGFPALARFLAPAAGFGMLGLALAFWRYGLRRYQSTGT